MVIVLFKPKIPDNYKAFCLASESNKQNLLDRTLDLPSFFCYKHITYLKTGFRLQKQEFALLALGQLLWPCLF